MEESKEGERWGRKERLEERNTHTTDYHTHTGEKE